MKILIGYDGSLCADAAVDDLARAGLPDIAEVQVLSVAEVWLPPPPPSSYEVVELAEQVKVPSDLHHVYTKSCVAAKAALESAQHARERLKAIFPKWEVSADSACGSPAWELVFKADHWKPDLLVVGSHGRTALGRFVLGSVSQRVLNEARCSVRIARGRVDEPNSPVRIIIGIDGSPGSESAVGAFAARKWPENTEVMFLTIDDPLESGVIGRIPPIAHMIEEANEEDRLWSEGMLNDAAGMLKARDVRIIKKIKHGDPRKDLPRIAEEWGADCIFVGSTGFSNRFERFVLGSVSAAVAARAHCSVEVVRAQSNE